MTGDEGQENREHSVHVEMYYCIDSSFIYVSMSRGVSVQTAVLRVVYEERSHLTGWTSPTVKTLRKRQRETSRKNDKTCIICLDDQ